MRRSAARLCAALACLTGAGLTGAAVTAAPAFAAQGVSVQVDRLPGTFTAGGAAGTMTAVATKSRGDCIKIRWSLVLRADGLRPDRVRVSRIEDDGPFEVAAQTGDGSVRLTDRRLDPGRLCRDQRVTARYDITVAGGAVEAGETAARLSLAVEAYSDDGDLLDRTTVTRSVKAGVVASPSAGPSGGPAPPSGSPAAGAGGGLAADPAGARSSAVRVGPIGLAVGAVMVLLGLGLLVRVRRRAR
jgi:hypothetical protein